MEMQLRGARSRVSSLLSWLVFLQPGAHTRAASEANAVMGKPLGEKGKFPGAQGVLESRRSAPDFETISYGIWVKTHPNARPCLKRFWAACEVPPPRVSWWLFFCCLAGFLHASPRQHTQFLSGCRGMRLLAGGSA